MRTLFYGNNGELASAQYNLEALLDIVGVANLREWNFELQNLLAVFRSETINVPSPLTEHFKAVQFFDLVTKAA